MSSARIGARSGTRRRSSARRRRLPISLPLAGALLLAAFSELWLGGLAGLVPLPLALREALGYSALGQALGHQLALQQVEVIGLRHLEAAELVARAPLHQGMPLHEIDVEAVIAALAAHPRVAGCRGVRLPPGRLLLEVEEREPLAVLAESGAGVDQTGARFQLAPGEAESLARLRGKAEWALPLLVAAREAGVSLGVVEARGPDDVRFQTSGSALAIVTGRDPVRSLEDLARLQAGGLLRGYHARELDLRFRGRAVLRNFEAKPEGGEDGAT